MATLERNIERGNDSIVAGEPDPTDAGTQAMDTIINVMHAGYSNALREAAEGILDPNVADEGGADFVCAGVTTPEEFFDTIAAKAREHFLAEQAGEES